MKKHKYSVGQSVYDTHSGENVTVEQKRTENTHLCYRLSNGAIRHENFLKA